jgi:mycothiol S-conjugate amidase
MDQPLCLLSVHAHPDDEASKGAPTVARYVAEGARAVLVCCTGGEEGDIHNPAMDTPQVRADLGAVRAEELRRSVEAIGYHEVVMLGYRDSGMPDSPANHHPASFHRADLDEAIGRLVAVIRRTRPQVILTYGDDQRFYPHPDHLRVHDISLPAFERAGDPAWYPEAGGPWAPSKLYYTVWSKARMVAYHEAFLRHHGDSPYGEEWLARPGQDERITTRIEIGAYYPARRAALLAHATQVDPGERWWFGLDDDQLAEAYPWEDWILAASTVGFPAPGTVEDDLFAGLRLGAATGREAAA